MSAKFFSVLAIALVVCLPGTQAFGHGTPIDVSVDSSGRLQTDHETYHGEFGGSLRTTTLPGFGVKLADSGLVNGDDLGVEVLQSLLFWDGDSVEATAATLRIENPDLTALRDVTGTTLAQAAIFWGTFDGTPGWHSHGDYTLVPNNSAQGVYGLVLRMVSLDDKYDPSKPFLITFNNFKTSTDVTNAAAAFAPMMVPEPGSLLLAAMGAGMAAWPVLRRRRAG